MTAFDALHTVMVRELAARGEPTTDTHLASLLGVSRRRVGQARESAHVQTTTLGEWCRRWEAAGYPPLSFLVARDGAWAGRADEVPPEMAAWMDNANGRDRGP